MSVPSGIATVKGKALGVAFNDFDGDGFPDIFVANDSMEQFLFHNQGDGTFKEQALQTGVAFLTMARAMREWASRSPTTIMTGVRISL